MAHAGFRPALPGLPAPRGRSCLGAGQVRATSGNSAAEKPSKRAARSAAAWPTATGPLGLRAGRSEQIHDPNAEGIGQLGQCLDGHVLCADLDAAEPLHGHVECLGQSLLGHVTSPPQFGHTAANVDLQALRVFPSHAGEARGRAGSPPPTYRLKSDRLRRTMDMTLRGSSQGSLPGRGGAGMKLAPWGLVTAWVGSGVAGWRAYPRQR